MPLTFRVAFLGFTEFERTALGSYFRLAGDRSPSYLQVQMLTEADFLVADADHAPSVQLVVATERVKEAVFIGSQAPAAAVAWMTRPIDALHVMRELDAMVAMQGIRRRSPPAEAEEESPPLTLRTDIQPAPPPPVARKPGLLERAAAALPAKPKGQAPAAPSPKSAPPPPPPQPPRALIVDDSELAQRFLETRLLPWGLVIDRADSSAKAAERMLRYSYDLVFLDIELGADSELDGLALCQHIKQSASAMNVSVILVSAHHTELDRVRGALAGCDGYLAKPLDPAELERLLLRHGLTAPGGKSGNKAKAARGES